MEENELDKSEEATPFKLKKAREKGNVARSLDLGFFAALAAAFAFFWIGGISLFFAVAQISTKLFISAGQIDLGPSNYPHLIGTLFAVIAFPLLAFGGSLFLVALFLDFMQVGPLFSTTPLKPDFNRINPAKGLKRIFSKRALIEAFKALMKLLIYSCIGGFIIYDALSGPIAAITDARNLGTVMMQQMIRTLAYCALAALAIAAIDQILVRREFSKKMRMSRREVKREYREREGEPRMKQKRKELHQEFTKTAEGLSNVKSADVIIINPEHFAVAIRYRREDIDAPVVVARGKDHFAQQIKDIAFRYGVLTIRKPELARALFSAAKIGSPVPEQYFQQVADVYIENNLIE
ncbi:flagellar biosynthesis protein FlhB [Sphingorhabdus arenilitoris]|uniref:Flagellar biosynthesis protein FlhB n=1 Tax=Sphingorhabdus arenilitoris TaxID=1490041 RepID=A0ABV8RFM2_9SPHN